MSPRRVSIAFATVLFAIFTAHGMAVQAQEPTAKPAAEIPASALVQPADVAQMLRGSQRPVVLQVGSHVLYAEAHIPESEYIGAASTSTGLQALRGRVAGLKKDQAIVIYCGCCPWDHCPNIRPAYEQLQALGFTHVKALYLAHNFGSDWAAKGYPVAKGR